MKLTSDALPWSGPVFCSLVWCAGDEAAPVSDEPRFMMLRAGSRRSYLLRAEKTTTHAPPLNDSSNSKKTVVTDQALKRAVSIYGIDCVDGVLVIEQEESTGSGQSDQLASFCLW